jgi:hypothetical protein
MLNTIIVTIPITKKGALNFFQVDIPSDVTGIFEIRAEATGLMPPALLMGKNFGGTLKLQSESSAGLCFSYPVWFGKSPVEGLLPGMADVNDEITSLFITPYYENDCKAVSTIQLKDSYTLYGCYEDAIGLQYGSNLSYTIGLYLSVQLEANTQTT